MPSHDVAPEQRARPVLDRATGMRFVIAIAVMTFVVPAVILRGGVDPLGMVLAAGTVIMLIIAAIQAWMLSTGAHLSRWSFTLIWAQLAVMILLLLGALFGAPIAAAVAGLQA